MTQFKNIFLNDMPKVTEGVREMGGTLTDFKIAIPEILEVYARQMGKGKHYFTENYQNRLTSSKVPTHVLESGRERSSWKEK